MKLIKCYCGWQSLNERQKKGAKIAIRMRLEGMLCGTEMYIAQDDREGYINDACATMIGSYLDVIRKEHAGGAAHLARLILEARAITIRSKNRNEACRLWKERYPKWSIPWDSRVGGIDNLKVIPGARTLLSALDKERGTCY